MSAETRTTVMLLTRFDAAGPDEAERFVERLEAVRGQIDRVRSAFHALTQQSCMDGYDAGEVVRHLPLGFVRNLVAQGRPGRRDRARCHPDRLQQQAHGVRGIWTGLSLLDRHPAADRAPRVHDLEERHRTTPDRSRRRSSTPLPAPRRRCSCPSATTPSFPPVCAAGITLSPTASGWKRRSTSSPDRPRCCRQRLSRTMGRRTIRGGQASSSTTSIWAVPASSDLDRRRRGGPVTIRPTCSSRTCTAHQPNELESAPVGGGDP